MSKNNLINLRDMDQDRARAIRSLGGKARQEQRKKELALHNFFRDYFRINNYYDKELEHIIASSPELNTYQKEIIKREFYIYLMGRGYIRDSQLTPEDKANIINHDMELTAQDLKRYFRTRSKPKHKKTSSKR